MLDAAAVLRGISLYFLSIFSGMNFYTSFVAHPIRQREEHPFAIRLFRHSVVTSSRILPLLLYVTLFTGFFSCLLEWKTDVAHVVQASGLTLCAAIMIYSIIFVSSLSAKLKLDNAMAQQQSGSGRLLGVISPRHVLEAPEAAAEAKAVMDYFAHRHRVRAVASLLALALLVAAAVMD